MFIPPPPDPHPGRCKNFRQGPIDMRTYMPMNRRCLRMDLHEGSCRFDVEPTPSYSTHDHYTMNVPRLPEPWVEPPAPNPQATDGNETT